jgi:hypothetical protein
MNVKHFANFRDNSYTVLIGIALNALRILTNLILIKLMSYGSFILQASNVKYRKIK